ncbi:HNH endonuclease [Halococcus salsus]|uniref:HNH endonuclease n=1 Tax=Halococcus salsus TaxID=2162894 RepID=UPI0013582E4D
MDSAQVNSQKSVPWNDGPYKRVLYCRAIQRELPQILTEHFEHNSEIPFDQRTIQADAKSLEPEDAYGYVNWLLGQDGLNEEAVEALEETVWALNGASPITAGVGSGLSSGSGSSSNRGTRQGRYQSILDRRYRDETLVRELKELYGNECQVCGARRQKGATTGYSEVHHIRPLGSPHEGPDERGNLLVLCPNHHSDFDYGTIEVDPNTLKLNHLYEASVSGTKLYAQHSVNPTRISYHNKTISQVS